ncbi:hypothetical protein [Olleya sp. ITB9]|uniref:hypothetical protein n=1 Tax=Olleya sp. ITB9 TaxID=1715648 RepID=UPI0006D0D06B|nr:hypothetical protein [Olleya sp. ITB9]
MLEEKINNLCFWDQITDGDVAEADQHYNGKEKPEEKRTFPVDSSSIYHFHPIAFVEHMKLITAPTQAPWVEYIYCRSLKLTKELKRKRVR